MFTFYRFTMPRNYKRKSLRATTYSQENLQAAVEKVRSHELSNYAASKIYGIPSSTLNDRVLKKTGVASRTLGRPPVIPAEMEARLALCLRTMEKWGWGLSRTEVMMIVAEFIKKNRIKVPFNNNKLSEDWFISFRKRQNLSIKKPQPVEYLRKRMTDPFVVDEYFTLLNNTLQELNLEHPHRIWNLDETSVSLDPTKTKVVGGVNMPCTRTITGSGKENITVLTTVNAAGGKMTPLIVFKGKYVYEQWIARNKEEYDFDISYAASKRGWMETEIFYNYMSKIIIPGLGNERPVLMVYDGHSTHVDDRVVALAAANNLTILKLPAHTSHLLQPLDLAVFKSFKSIWDKKLVEWQRHNVGIKMRKQAFAEMFAEAWHQTSPNVIKSGFKKGGIYPFNSEVIPKEKYDPAAYKRWQNQYKDLMPLNTLQQLCINVINNTMSCITCASEVQTQNVNVHTKNAEKPAVNTSFEDLLLQKLTQQSRNTINNNTIKLKRVAKGAEVITRTFLEKQRNITDTQEKEKNNNLKVQSTFKSLEVAGPSGLSKTKAMAKNDAKSCEISKKICTAKKRVNTSTISAKGKGVGKRTRTGNENTTVNTINKHGCLSRAQNKKNKGNLTNSITQKNLKTLKKTTIKSAKIPVRRFTHSSITTSESGEMSSHSDSDLVDVLSETYSDTVDDAQERMGEMDKIAIFQTGKIEENLEPNNDKGFSTSLIQIDATENKDKEKKKVTILSSVRFAPENRVFLETSRPLNLKPIDKTFDLSTNPKQKRKLNEKDKENKPEEEGKKILKNKYNIGDTVLTRYFTKSWKYYVGVIKNINLEAKEYNICYYKTICKKNDIKFIVPKRKDHDSNLPENSVVKTIDLLQINETPVEYVLMNDEDVIYFL